MPPTSPDPRHGWSVDPGYIDAHGRPQQVDPAVRRAIEAAVERTAEAAAARGAAVAPIVTRPDEDLTVTSGGHLVLEDGAVVALRPGEGLPGGLPLGYHRLHPSADGPPRGVIVSPGRCHRPDWFPAWGWSVQLYALRSQRSWGVGDLADLRRFGRMAAGQGASVLLVNPLHATAPAPPVQPSPYSPSSRRYLSPLWLSIDDVPGRDGVPEVDALAATGTSLDHERLIARDPALRLKLRALDELWGRFGGDPDFDRFLTERGEDLRTYTAFCALADQLGPDWRTWPPELRHPAGPAVEQAAGARARRPVHAWAQWLTERQLAAAAAEIGLIGDLPVGFDRAGADAWQYQDLIVDGYTIGAPPDVFQPDGQDWGLPVFSPPALAGAGYEPFARTIRASLRHAAGLRIDHVMGLFRQWWVPEGASPAMGAYVRFPATELLDVLALESHRAGAFVVGEDLGTVEGHVREELAAREILSYRLLWFEDEPPDRWPARSLGAVSTHDLPTVAGVWTGADADERRALGVEVDAAALDELRGRLTGAPPDASPAEAADTAHQLLATAASDLVAVSLEDALGVPERPNVPGLDDRRPNWCLALPVTIEELADDPRVQRVADIMRRRSGSRPS